MQHAFSYRTTLLLCLSVVVTVALWSQVKIRERVTIAPTADTTRGANSPLLEKWKSLTRNATKVNAVGPGKNKARAVIGIPNGGRTTVTVLDGASSATLDLVLRSPVQEVILPDANSHHGFAWDTTGLSAGTSLDIGLVWHFQGGVGSEYDCDVERINDSTYILGFEDIGVAPMYVDLIVLVQLGQVPVLDHFAVTLTPETIHHLDVSTIHVQAKDAFNNDLYVYNAQVRITGSDAGTYGHVQGNWVSGEIFSYRDVQSGTVRYYADSLDPGQTQSIIVRVEKADDPGKNGSATITLLPGAVNHFVVTVTPDSIVYEDIAFVSALLVDDHGDEVPLDDNAPVTVTAMPDTTGRFYQTNPMRYGDIKVGNVIFQASPEQALEFRDVVFKVEGPGNAGEAKIVVKPKPCLVMDFSKTTVAPGDTVVITFRQLQLDGSYAPYPADQMFRVRMNTDDTYGILQSGWGWQGADLTGPPPFLFIAGSTLAQDPATVVLQAMETSGGVPTAVWRGPKPELQKQAQASAAKLTKILSGGTMSVGAKSAALSKDKFALWQKPGGGGNLPQGAGACVPTGMVVVRGGTILKVTVARATLQPLGDDDNKDNPNYNSKGPDKRKKIIDWTKRKSTDVTVTATDGRNNPIPGYPITLSAFIRPNSGGHDHNDTRPTGKFVTPGRDTVSSLSGTTNSEGKATYRYICSGFGGADSLFLKGKTETDTSSTIVLLEFAKFQELTEGDHYKLIGAHSQGASSEHEKNHFGTKTLISVLKELADTAYSEESYTLRFNDMSLIYGGPFDYWNNWDTPHQDHRQGVCVDLSSLALNDDETTSDISQEELTSWLKELTQDFSYYIENETQTARHFHLTVR